MRSLPLVLALAAWGCATADAPPVEPEPRDANGAEPVGPPPEARHAEFPYSAEQIRDATPKGRRIHFRIGREDGSQYELIMEFTAVADDRCTVRTSIITPAGDETPVGQSDATWMELRAHAAFPAESTRVTDTDVTVPAGTYACRLYTITESTAGGTKVRKIWFATDLPGPPVKQVTTIDGATVSQIELIENRLP